YLRPRNTMPSERPHKEPDEPHACDGPPRWPTTRARRRARPEAHDNRQGRDDPGHDAQLRSLRMRIPPGGASLRRVADAEGPRDNPRVAAIRGGQGLRVPAGDGAAVERDGDELDGARA